MKHPHYASTLLCSALAFFIVGCSGDKPEQLIASSKAYLAKDDMRAAVIQLKTALQKSPSSAEARFLLGSALLREGDGVAATVELEKARALKYPESQVVPELARALMAQGKAKEVIEKLGAVDLPDREAQASLKTTLATAYAASNDAPHAQAALDAAIASVPAYPPALVLQARLAAASGNLTKAMTLTEQALVAAPTNVDAWILKGDLLARGQHDLAGGLDAYRKALALQANSIAANSSIIELNFSRSDLKAAELQIAELKKVRPNEPVTQYFEARIAFARGDQKRARELTQQLLKRAPDNVNLLQLAGAVELESRNYRQAELLLQKALLADPQRTPLRALLAKAYVSSGQPAKALATLSPLLDDAAANPVVLAIAGEAHLRLGDTDKAEALFAKAAKLDPADTRSRTALAMTQLAKGRDEAAFSDLHDIALADKGTSTDLVLINALMAKRKFDEAFKALDTLEHKIPDQPLAFHLRGMAQLATGHPDLGRQSFEKALAKDASFFPAAAQLAGLDIRDKKPDLAQKRLEDVLRAQPGQLKALLALAELKAKTGAKPEEVGALLSEAVKLHPTEAAPRLMQIGQQLALKQPKLALETAQAALTVLPDDARLTEALGRAQAATGDSNQAMKTFNKLATMEPTSPMPHLQIAALFLASRDNAAAEQSLRRALEITPNLLPAQEQLLKLQIESGKTADALALARQVQTQRPQQSPGFFYEGQIEARRKNWSAAAAAFKKGSTLAAPTPAAIGYHSTLRASGKASDAKQFADTWVKEHPKDATFLQHLGEVDLAAKDFAAAEAHFAQLLKLQPDNPIALNNLSWLLVQAGKPGALEYAQRANTLVPNQPSIMDTLALALAAEKQLDKAIEVQVKAVALAPNSDTLRLGLAKLYVQAGQKTLAKAELDRIAKAGDKFAGQAEVAALLKSL